jgi:hypothetical protein
VQLQRRRGAEQAEKVRRLNWREINMGQSNKDEAVRIAAGRKS